MTGLSIDSNAYAPPAPAPAPSAPPSAARPGRLDGVLSHELTKLVIGFLLTGVLGSYLSTHYQRNSDREKHREELAATRTAFASSVMDSVDGLLAASFSAINDYHNQLQVGTIAPTELARLRLRAAEGYARLVGLTPGYEARVCLAFGNALRMRFGESADLLIGAGDAILLTPTDSKKRLEAAMNLGRVQPAIYQLAYEMANGVRAMTVRHDTAAPRVAFFGDAASTDSWAAPSQAACAIRTGASAARP